MYDTRTITTESDLHGEPCPFCQDAPCVTNVYLVNADGQDDMAHTCGDPACIEAAADPGRHFGDAEVLVEISAALLPWEAAHVAAATTTPAVAA